MDRRRIGQTRPETPGGLDELKWSGCNAKPRVTGVGLQPSLPYTTLRGALVLCPVMELLGSCRKHLRGVEKLFDILYEDSGLLVINKPAGLVCHPTKTDQYSSLISRARLHLGPGSHPQLVNRLDRETSGVTLVAKDADYGARAAANLGEPASREGLPRHRARACARGARDH